jgi:DNA polymerase
MKAPKGKRLVCVDASQIEARLVAWLAGCRTLTDTFAAGRDPYSEFAAIVFGHPVNRKDNPTERQVGKVSILQLGYQSGAAKLQKKLEGSGIVVGIEQATDYVDTYRSTYDEIPRLWRGMERSLRETVRSGLSRNYALENLLFTKLGILLPSGRWLYYPMLREAQEDEPANNVFAGQLVYWSAKYKVWKQLYGGSITENVIQAMARDVVTEVHATYIDDVVMQGHDELVQVVPEGIAPQRRLDTIREMSTAPAWCHHPTMGLPPLSAEGYISDCYADTLT